MRQTGTYQTLGSITYFIPYSLPPQNPPFEFTKEILSLYGEASFALGQLNEMSLRLPDPNRFIKAYVIKEALLSSAIEGIHTTLAEIFTYNLENFVPNKDTQLVLNYTKSLETAFKMIKEEGFPLVSRVILKAHKVLMSAGDGDRAMPGQYRKQSVRVGNLIPAPAQEVIKLMAELEQYINESFTMPPLIKAGLAHVQFETIHPFLDGNGRIGRLLIVLMLAESGQLNLPILYPSYYFKKHHMEYYQRLDRVRTHGDFEGWILYYLKAIRDSSIDAYNRAKKIEELEIKFKKIIYNSKTFSQTKSNAELVLNFLFQQPITTVTQASQKLDKAYNTIRNVLKGFIKEGIVTEEIISPRNRLYRFDTYLHLLEKENG